MNSFFPSMLKALFYWSLVLVLFPFGDASEIKFQNLDISDHHYHSSSASVCNRASTTGFENRLEVVHNNDPCAHGKYKRRPKLSSAEILDKDLLRVKSIQARVVGSINTNIQFSLDETTKIPVGSGVPFDTHNYMVTIGLGTPKRNLTLAFDTGSELTWTQCQPCVKHCYQQKDPIFNPNNSTSYSSISCNSKDCPQDTFGCYNNITCAYGIRYEDNSYTKGFLNKDKLTITPTDVFDNFLFGCGQNSSGSFGKIDGILGLNKDPISFVSQTAQKYDKYFSYCLPKSTGSTGFLEFGKKDDAVTMISTPFVPPPPDVSDMFYFIEITTISVGRTQLAINESVFKKAGTIIDSGTVITRLPLAAYSAMSEEFKKQMNVKKYKSGPAFEILDTCFHIDIGAQDTNNIEVPKVSFTFKGDATVDLDASGTLWVVNSTFACLAFAGKSDPSDFAIFGNTQQKTFEVAYDVARQKLGFIHNPNCQ
ncbi:hypothetical protein CASFOL_030006 [Castilleja foliolosa]|uniref:Peptidase A1 domain-containing protein n=1 Tax=Castilleja foliolosa TaxID=1961234 RepID=A0ABD3CA71_9LAMI